jgi:chromosome segregation ATPase
MYVVAVSYINTTQIYKTPWPSPKTTFFGLPTNWIVLGQSPTLAAVRKHLGGGSFTTISEAMSEWKSKRASKDAPLREPAPQAIQDQLTSLAGDIWALAIATASGRLDAERQSMQDNRVAVEAERLAAVELADQVIAELEELKQKTASIEDERVKLQDNNQQLKAELANTLERAASAEARAIEITRRADDLNAELLRVNTQNSELIKALAQKVSTNLAEKTLPDDPTSDRASQAS